MPGKALDLALLEGADHHDVHHAADDAGGVFDGFAAAELAVAGGQVHYAAAHLIHAGLEADAGARAGLFKNHGQGAVGIGKGLVFLESLELGLDEGGAAQQVGVFIGREIGKLQVVADGRGHGGKGAVGVGRPIRRALAGRLRSAARGGRRFHRPRLRSG